MKVANLSLAILSLVVRAVRKYFRQTIDSLALPRAHLIGMHLMPRRDLLDRLVAPQRFQRHTRLELARKPSPRRHLVSLRYPREYTLSPCPICQDQLSVPVRYDRVRRHAMRTTHINLDTF